MSGTVLGPGDATVNQTDKNPHPCGSSYILLQGAVSNVFDLLSRDHRHGEK